MLMVGQGVAEFAQRNDLALPYTVQDPPVDLLDNHETLSDMFSLRRSLKAGRQSIKPGRHAGLGLDNYVQATSPLRRYLDLVVHQQLRAHMRGDVTLDEQSILERVGAAEAVRKDVRWAERQSNQHWTLVYLLQNPVWMGEGVVVDLKRKRALVLIPELEFETIIYLKSELKLDSVVKLELEGVNLAQLRAFFHVIDVRI